MSNSTESFNSFVFPSCFPKFNAFRVLEINLEHGCFKEYGRYVYILTSNFNSYYDAIEGKVGQLTERLNTI